MNRAILNDTRGGEAPAATDSDHPIDWAISRTFLKFSLAFIMVGAAAYLLAILVFARDQELRMALAMSYMSVAAVSWVFLARDRVRVAVCVLGVGLWLFMTGAAIFLGGVASTSTIIYPLVILLAGWMVGARAAVLVAMTTVSLLLFLVYAESQGWLPPAPRTLPLMRWIVQASVFLLTALLVGHFVRAYRERLAEVRKLGDTLAQRAALLEASAADLHRAQALAHVGSWVVELSDGRMRLSDETCRIYGVPAGTIGNHAGHLSRVDREDRAAVDAAWQAALADGTPFDCEHRIGNAGQVSWVRQQARFDRDAAGRLVRAVGTTHEITERKHAQAEIAQLNASLEARVRERTAALLETNRELESFSYTISHDLRGPLRSMVGFAGLLIENLNGKLEDENRAHLARIDASGNRMSRLIDGVLDYSRLARSALGRREIDLDALVRDIGGELRERYPATEIVQGPLGNASADPTMMRQIFHNLIDNGLKYSSKNPKARVEIAVQRSAAGVEYFVRDNGVGFDMQYADHLFKLFTRLHSDADFESTGAGLAIVKRLVERHGGAIRAEAQPGRGATFSFRF